MEKITKKRVNHPLPDKIIIDIYTHTYVCIYVYCIQRLEAGIILGFIFKGIRNEYGWFPSFFHFSYQFIIYLLLRGIVVRDVWGILGNPMDYYVSVYELHKLKIFFFSFLLIIFLDVVHRI